MMLYYNICYAILWLQERSRHVRGPHPAEMAGAMQHLFMWGSDSNFTNYNFRKTIELSERKRNKQLELSELWSVIS